MSTYRRYDDEGKCVEEIRTFGTTKPDPFNDKTFADKCLAMMPVGMLVCFMIFLLQIISYHTEPAICPASEYEVSQ